MIRADPIASEILMQTDQHGAYFEKPFLVSVLNEVEDLDEDGVEDHYDLDDDEDGQTDNWKSDLGWIHGIVSIMPIPEW